MKPSKNAEDRLHLIKRFSMLTANTIKGDYQEQPLQLSEELRLQKGFSYEDVGTTKPEVENAVLANRYQVAMVLLTELRYAPYADLDMYYALLSIMKKYNITHQNLDIAPEAFEKLKKKMTGRWHSAKRWYWCNFSQFK
ncbi:MAG: hypothetical protein ACI9TY_001434 [Alphaproteobacteria bacterium]|jgi:hypothetical protein